ncbi:MAG: nitroreductase [Parvibaculaceae bacterium]|nr:nitroreductase [Parvibaculaceae bacterium]
MKVSDALASRITCRAFLDKPVPDETLKAVLEGARHAPSGGNLQPWHVYAVSGDKLKSFISLIAEKQKTTPMGEGSEYDIYPKGLKEPYKARRFKCGEDLYATMNIARDDKVGRLMQFARNFQFFGAPTGLFFAIDRQMGLGQWSDLGMFIQSLMLLAREHGLHTAAQEAWAIWHTTVTEFIGIPDELMLFCGMAIGYMDESHPMNSLRTDRAPLEEVATFIS